MMTRSSWIAVAVALLGLAGNTLVNPTDSFTDWCYIFVGSCQSAQVSQHASNPNTLPQTRHVELNLVPAVGQPISSQDVRNLQNMLINPADIQFEATGVPSNVGQQIIAQIRNQLGNQPLTLAELNKRNLNFTAGNTELRCAWNIL